MSFIVRPTITATFLERVRTCPDQVAFRRKRAGSWQKISFREFYDECRLVSFGLTGLGVNPRDNVSILSDTRLEWSLSDMAILGAGAVTVPIYASNPAADVAYILNHS